MAKKTECTLPYRRIVAKFGTSLLTAGTSKLNHDKMSDLVNQLARLHEQGAEVVVVTSGAIAAGREKLGLTKKIKGIPYKQVLASVGQSRLMNLYERLFDRHGVTVAQALLTKADLRDRHGYLNTRNTLLALLEMGVICIVNENDVVAVDEIEEAQFGDNDNLSAMVANLIDADLLLILTDIDGLYTADPNKDPDARLIPLVEKIDARIEGLVSGSTSGLGTGGMVTKIEAAKMATDCGITVVIANGRQPDVLQRLAAGESVGTRFLPVTAQLDSRERWILSGLRTRGTVVVDTGAALALRRYKRSLLAAGIQQVEGNFRRGDIVNIQDTQGVRLGCGITNYDAEELLQIKGIHSEEIVSRLGHDYGSEVVHRNNLVML
ncbi:MAG: glutamate 5-kinase [Dehalococcoidales bacterium]|nr:glutamate 5-kinase [Dehalococcoidales bacterium]